MPVTHTDYPGQVGTVIAAQHCADRYLVRWADGGTSYHIQAALHPATENNAAGLRAVWKKQLNLY